MTARNSVKTYIENGYYHIYNRGVEKRKIFLDEQDYSVFLSYLKEYLIERDINSLQTKLSDPKNTWRDKASFLKLIKLNNFYNEISLLAYCLMPNHFHLLIKQKSSTMIDSFMNSLSTRYVMYFNKKYKRVGPLYQDVYKAVSVGKDEQLVHLSSYIHRNPLKLINKQKSKAELLDFLLHRASSLAEYLGFRKTSWVKTDEILSFFSKSELNKRIKYKEFVLESPAPNNDIIIDNI